MPIRPIYKRSKEWYGCLRDLRDARDLYYEPEHNLLQAVSNTNFVIDHRHKIPAVMDQGPVGSCTAHGITGPLRSKIIEAGHNDRPLSRLQLYFDERDREGSTNDDSGAEIRDGIWCTAHHGVAHEQLWPYDIAKLKDKPTTNVYTDALKFEALEYKRIRIGRDKDGNYIGDLHVRAALKEGFLPIIGLTLYQSFESKEVERTGMVPMPNLHQEEAVGGHCMYLWGQNLPGREHNFGTRNSWNTDWGDKGDCYLPGKMIGSPQYGSDYWIITKVDLRGEPALVA